MSKEIESSTYQEPRKALDRRCNICLLRRRMTKDHIFPKGITAPGQKLTRKILSKLDPSCGAHARKSVINQNGYTKSTICSDCNNKILGAKLDPSLSSFCKEIDLYVRNTSLLMSPVASIKGVQLNKVVRSVVGHLLASDDNPNVRSPKTQALRRYLFNHNENFPEKFQILFWLYPFREQVIARDIFSTNNPGSGSLLWTTAYKAYPVGFAICQNIDNYKFDVKGLIDITPYLDKNIDREYSINISLRTLVPYNWPEAPATNGFILTSGSPGTTTTPYMNKKNFPY